MTLKEQRTRLAALQEAQTKLLSGRLTAEVSYADKKVKYAATNLDDLSKAIRDAEADLARAQGGVGSRRHGYIRTGI